MIAISNAPHLTAALFALVLVAAVVVAYIEAKQ